MIVEDSRNDEGKERVHKLPNKKKGMGRREDTYYLFILDRVYITLFICMVVFHYIFCNPHGKKLKN